MIGVLAVIGGMAVIYIVAILLMYLVAGVLMLAAHILNWMADRQRKARWREHLQRWPTPASSHLRVDRNSPPWHIPDAPGSDTISRN